MINNMTMIQSKEQGSTIGKKDHPTQQGQNKQEETSFEPFLSHCNNDINENQPTKVSNHDPDQKLTTTKLIATTTKVTTSPGDGTTQECIVLLLLISKSSDTGTGLWMNSTSSSNSNSSRLCGSTIHPYKWLAKKTFTKATLQVGLDVSSYIRVAVVLG